MGIHTGHRQRVKEKIAKSGLDAFADHEVLEALLFYAIPYRDTNPIAHDLLTACGSLSHMLRSPAATIAAVNGCGARTAEFLMLFSEAGRRTFISSGHANRYDTTEAMRSLALRTVAHTAEDCTYLMLFDNCFSLLDTRMIYDGYLASAAVTANSIAEPALLLHASGAVLVTRHKNRIACPDRYEMETVRHLSEVLGQIGIHLLECYVVGGNLAIPMLKNHKTSFPVFVGSPDALSDDEAEPNIHEVMPTSSPYAEGLDDRTILTSLFEYLMPTDTGEAAHRLYTAYGSLYAVISADDEELLAHGITSHALSFLRFLLPAYGRCLRAAYPPNFRFCDEDIGSYFTACFSGMTVEAVYLLLLREDMTMIDCRRMALGSTNSANLNMRALVEAALFSGARHVALAHNHPNGSTLPSEADRATTKALKDAFSTIGVGFIEHYTIAGNLYSPILAEEKNEDT